MKHNSITTIKCRFSNSLHRLLDPKFGIKRSERWKTSNKNLTDKEKVKLFDEIMKIHNECSTEISDGLYKRRQKKRIQKEREARGYTPKRKTSLAEYQKMLQGQEH